MKLRENNVKQINKNYYYIHTHTQKSQIENDCNTSSNKTTKVDLNMQQWPWIKRNSWQKYQENTSSET